MGGIEDYAAHFNSLGSNVPLLKFTGKMPLHECCLPDSTVAHYYKFEFSSYLNVLLTIKIFILLHSSSSSFLSRAFFKKKIEFFQILFQIYTTSQSDFD
jgi:hypothetical protein